MSEKSHLQTVSIPVYSKLQQGIAFVFLSLILLTATEAFTRFGIATVIWLIIYAGSLLYIVLDYNRFVTSLIISWPAILVPFLALLSAFWSESPEWSLYASLQLIYTMMIAIWIATRFDITTVFIALALAAGLGVGASVFNEYVQFINPYQEMEYHGAPSILIGIYNQKNGLGNTIGILTFALLIIGIKYRKLVFVLFIALLLIFPLQKVQSSRSILIYILTMGLPLYWLILQKKGQRFLVLLITTVIILLCSFLLLILDIDPINFGLESIGKDSTLTGRTIIWSVGLNVFEQNPILGVGYQAFWQPGVFEEVKQIHAGLGSKQINVFHSAFVEMLVALGSIGLVLFVIFLCYTIYYSIVWFLKEGSIESFGAVFFIITEIIIASTETILVRQHEIGYILVVVFLVKSRINNLSKRI